MKTKREDEVTVRIVNHGCRLNQFEGEALGGCLEKSGFKVVEGKEGPRSDVTIINTCTVTGKSDRKSRNTILRAAQAKKESGILIVTGCYAETDADTLAEIEGVDLVVGNPEKTSIPGIVASLLDGNKQAGVLRGADGFADCSTGASFNFEDPLNPHRSRVYVKVQDGCSTGCAYCKVPLARGSSRSRDLDEILGYVGKLVAGGYEEIVLTGVNLGDYCHEGKRLHRLLSRLLALPGTFRVRLSSIEPMHFDDGLFALLCHPRIAPHFHVPLQSGSDRVLRLMGRPYRTADFVAIADRIRQLRPESHIATDLITGFPGEQEEDFNATVRAVERVGFASMHVFKYSPRAGTRAAELPDSVPYRVKAARSAGLIGMRDRLNELFRRRFLGTVREAVLERSGRAVFGITDNYIRVRICGGTDPGPEGRPLERPMILEKQMLSVRVVEVTARQTLGVLLSDERV